MSPFVLCGIVVLACVASLCVALSEQLRAESRRRRADKVERLGSVEAHSIDASLTGLHWPVDSSQQPAPAVRSAASVTAETRAATYRNILDLLGDDLDQDIDEWETVLQDFPQVRFPNESPRRESHEPAADKFTQPNRTRRVSAEEREMIVRLSNTEFADEEIALWLNLPLERVQELLNRR